MTTTITVLKKKKLKNPILVTGLPGIGLVGKLVVDYLLKELKAERVAEVHSDSFPPAVHTHNSQLSMIRDDFFHLRAKNRDFLFLAGPVQPALDMRYATSAEHYEFARKIVDFAEMLGVKEIYTIAGINIGDARITKEPRVIVCATDKKIVDAFVKLGCVSSSQDGLISGAAGLILGVAGTRGLS
ncbi:MAG: PAC2 family protein, partial [Candidatus Diapherotrites archaeon]|nr:PAC2 family protein [Candidatus Diapherotrites archaeon]